MRPVGTGVQWTSRVPGTKLMAMVMAVGLALPIVAGSAPAAAASTYILMPRSELLTRPTSGSAWANLRAVADESLGTANLCDQDEDHHLRTLASALVFARTGIASFGTKARAGVMAAIGTQTVGCNNATLALGRQLTGYVLAADFAALAGANDTTFRSWLSPIRTRIIGGHSVWDSLVHTHNRSAANWSSYAGASRIAASLYLGDAADVAAAALVTRGFLGDRSAYAGFTHTLDSDDLSWACSGSQSTYTPVNPACTKGGINIDGTVVTDISRSGPLTWPPGGTAVQYQLDSIQGVGLQVELLYRNGYGSAWGWSSNALRRMAGAVTRSKASGGTGWNETSSARQMPWLLNKRYGLSLPTTATSMGRAIGFTNWLYGSGGGGGTNPPPPPPPGNPPVATAPRILLSAASRVPGAGVPVAVRWGLASSLSGVRRYDLQLRVGGGAFAARTLSSRTATSYRTILASGRNYVFRVRAVDRSGRVGAWVYSRTTRPSAISDGSSLLRWSGSWSRVPSRNYLGGYVHSTNGRGRTATMTFSGAGIAWVGPVGPTRGRAQVFLDGSWVATVNLYRSSFQPRRIVFARNVADGTHTLVIKTLATRGHPTVAIDGLYVVNPS